MSLGELEFVHRFELVDPDGPTLLLLHGTGGDENSLMELGASLAPGWNLLSPRGKVDENDNWRFFRRLAPNVFDLEDLHCRTHQLAEFVRKATELYGLPRDRVVALGLSNGANIAVSMFILRPQALVAAVLFRPLLPLRPDAPPDLWGKRILVCAGRRDSTLLPLATEELIELLTSCGARVEVLWQDADHNLIGADIEAAREFLKQF
jgi:predicted esterase